MYYKCCVPGCVSSRQDAFLHKFPKCEKRLKKWLDHIKCDSLRNKSAYELHFFQVCHKHFEPRFVTQKSRLRSSGYPTLFLQSEILSGTPVNPGTIETRHQVDEHRYAKKIHYDHNYSKQSVRESQHQKNLESTASHLKQFTKKSHKDRTNFKFEGLPFKEVDWKTTVSSATDTRADQFISELSADPGSPEVVEWIDEAIFDAQSVHSRRHSYDSEADVCIGSPVVEIDDDTQSVDSRHSCGSEGSDVAKAAHEGLCCNVCLEPIVGFRYVCVECPDYDLCAACEARSAHPAHYVLRVPGPRPYSEINEVLEAIRRAIAQTQQIMVDCSTALDEIIKSEPEDEGQTQEEKDDSQPQTMQTSEVDETGTIQNIQMNYPDDQMISDPLDFENELQNDVTMWEHECTVAVPSVPGCANITAQGNEDRFHKQQLESNPLAHNDVNSRHDGAQKRKLKQLIMPIKCKSKNMSAPVTSSDSESR